MNKLVFLHRPKLGGQDLLRHIAYGLFQLPEPLRSRHQVPQDQHLPLIPDEGQRGLHRAGRKLSFCFCSAHFDPSKKILSLTLALAMIGTILTGCGSKNDASEAPAEDNTQQTASVQQEQSQTEKALALINTFATGDTDTARSLLDDGYIQHNLAYGTGADAFIGSVEYLASADVKTTVNNIRAFEDGDKVFLQTIYNFAGAGEQVAFDIFRFDENGKIAEHWDVMETIADQSTWQNENGKF